MKEFFLDMMANLIGTGLAFVCLMVAIKWQDSSNKKRKAGE
jgi:hypothetical protein